MRVKIYGVIEGKEEITRQLAAHEITADFSDVPLKIDNVSDVAGCEALWINTVCIITEELAVQLKNSGIRFITTRSSGTNHVNLDALKKLGIKVANVPDYSPSAIAEQAVLSALLLLRKSKKIEHMILRGDFSHIGMKGKELNAQTVGIIGTGRIGRKTIQLLQGFGSTILAYSGHQIEGLGVSYVALDELFSNSDIIILHCPLTDATRNIINRRGIEMMKDGVYLINNARGGLIEIPALIEALDNGKIAGCAIDVWEDERPYLKKKVDLAVLDPLMLDLMHRENVIFTPHTAFYTDKAESNMTQTTIKNLIEYKTTGACRNEKF